MEINKSGVSGEDEEREVSAYLPSQWNNEFVDFITLMVLASIIYLFTHFGEKEMISSSGSISPTFLFGYIIGLGYPIFRRVMNKGVSTNYTGALFLAIIAIIAIISNYSGEGEQNVNISIYFITLFLLIYGLYLSRKESETRIQTKVFKKEKDKCVSSSTGLLQTSGEKININIAFISFVLLLLFKNDPSNPLFRLLIYFLFGTLLGILVSSSSYFGVEYFLEKMPEKECDNIEECDIKEMKVDNKSIYQLVKEYILKVSGQLTDEQKAKVAETQDILDQNYQTSQLSEAEEKEAKKSKLAMIFNQLGFSASMPFMERFKRIAIIIIVVLVLLLIYFAVTS